MAETSSASNTQHGERFAFVTLVTSDSYVDGALVLLYSLRQTLTPYTILCLTTPSALSQHSLERLRSHFDGVIETDLHLSSDHDSLSLLGRPDLCSTLTKIQLWDPALFGPWDAVCYLDADTLVRKPIDDIFDRYYAWRQATSPCADGGLIAAAPDTGWPDCFNSGVLLLAPGYKTHSDLYHRTMTSTASFDGADQGLLNEHFSDWSQSGPYRRLPFLYNSTANIYYTYKPAMKRFGHDIRVVHFIGVSKPWHWNRTEGGSLISEPGVSERWSQLVALWWNIHDEYVSKWRYWKGSYDKSIALSTGYQHITEPPESVLATIAKSEGISLDKTCDASEETDNGDEALEDGNDQVHEVSDWDKDWSWAQNRVHPFDYAYLEAHVENAEDHAPANTDNQQFDSSIHNVTDESKQDYSVCDQTSERFNTHAQERGQSHDSEHGQTHEHTFKPSEHGEARERYSDEYVPNDQSDHDHHSHHDYYEAAQHQPEDMAPAAQQNDEQRVPEWMNSQRPWEDVAREGWMHHDDYQPHTYDQSFVDRHIDNYDHHDHDHNYQDQHHQEVYHENNAQPQAAQAVNPSGDYHTEFIPAQLPQDQPLYEASQVVLQPYEHPHHQTHYKSKSMHDLPSAQPPHDHQDHSNDNNRGHNESPLYYPQPKTPLVVNPVALWESEKDQERRREWAQQLQSPNGGPQDQIPAAFNHINPQIPNTIDYIDSSQLPQETPWKISQVRRRPSRESIDSASTTHGLQFKEGVASDASARNVASDFLRRWHEAVVAREINPNIEGLSSEHVHHATPKIELGTDAIRMETTVSCEAEDSRGERTVYRFTLSSTLDVGGAQPQQDPAHQPGAGIAIHQPSSAVHQPSTASNAPELVQNDGSMTVLRQPQNYQEPVISRRSSAVHLPNTLRPDNKRAPHSAAMSGQPDQFAEADARYWQLQRQLIDLKMRQKNNSTDAAPNGHVASKNGQQDDWAIGDDKMDLSTPPTPTNLSNSRLNSFNGTLRRRGSAFSIADNAAHDYQSQAEGMADKHAQYMSVGDVPQSSYTAMSQGYMGDQQPGIYAGDKLNTRNRAASSPLFHNGKTENYEQPSLSTAAFQRLDHKGVTLGSNQDTSTLQQQQQRTLKKQVAEVDTIARPIAVPIATPVPKPNFAVTVIPDPVYNNDSDNNNDKDKDEEARVYRSAIGRSPTPFPKRLLRSKIADDDKDSDDQSLDSISSGSGAKLQRVKPVGLKKLHLQQTPGDTPSLDSNTGFGTRFNTDTNTRIPDVPPISPVTPGFKRKIKPKFNWGDEDDFEMPDKNDMSVDAQWTRIVHGAPPKRSAVRPAGSSGTATPQTPILDALKTVEKDAVVGEQKDTNDQSAIDSEPKAGGDSEELEPPQSAPESRSAENDSYLEIDLGSSKPPVQQLDDSSSAVVKQDDKVANAKLGDEDSSTAGLQLDINRDTKPDKTSIEKMTVGQDTVAEASNDNNTDSSKGDLSRRESKSHTPTSSGQQTPKLKRSGSTKSFPNLMSRDIDTVSDSELDTSDVELQERFWQRAMKQKTSSPGTPRGRRKSIVEISSSISAEDLAQWMKWGSIQQESNQQQPEAEDTAPVDDAGDDHDCNDNTDATQLMITPPPSNSMAQKRHTPEDDAEESANKSEVFVEQNDDGTKEVLNETNTLV